MDYPQMSTDLSSAGYAADDGRMSIASVLRGLHHADHGMQFVQTDLVSDGSVPAANTDPNLVNPWGISYSPTGPFWISDNGTGLTTIYNASGATVTVAGNTQITIPPPSGQSDPAAPTGQAFNDTQGFMISQNGVSAPADFLFATEDGTISGWNPTVNSGSAVLAVDNSATGAVYKGLTMLPTADGPLLYAANFNAGTVDVFDSSFNQVNSFTDPNLPAGYAPFNVQALNGNLFVTFAQQDAAKHDDVAGAGHGFVDEFSANGTLIARIASHGPLDSPWGLAIAPSSFGRFAGDLLVGNFGDGTIDAYNLTTDQFVGKLMGSNDELIKIDGLWSITPGNGGSAGSSGTLYFTAGPNDEQNGVFGSLTPATGTGHSYGA